MASKIQENYSVWVCRIKLLIEVGLDWINLICGLKSMQFYLNFNELTVEYQEKGTFVKFLKKKS